MTERAATTAPQQTPQRRHGLAGLLVVLFAVAGLVFSYGLEHAPPPDVCHPHAVTWLAPAADGSAHRHLVGVDGAPLTSIASHHRTPPAPVDTCLCLAVLLGFMLLALAARPGRWRFLLPARLGWRPAEPSRPCPAPLSLASLQVLRL
ncbi:hypothetical protein [Actinomadura gamaensis]|uniref:Uncharacterized protein n=1 Tax=Actinomadura gamaensis TaxID=1763541 RepID=A0ABV9UD68_9ACTN